MSGETSAWSEYFAAHRDRAPRPFLLDVLARWPTGEGRRAVDLGCGTGSETLAMLNAGWVVTAVDAEAEALEVLRSRVRAEHAPRLVLRQARMEEFSVPEAALIHAGFSLPFIPQATFADVWRRIFEAVTPSGRFAGQLFGPKDSWSGNPGMNFHARPDVDALLSSWTVEQLYEQDEDGDSLAGPKHWHVWHVVAQKPGAGEGSV